MLAIASLLVCGSALGSASVTSTLQPILRSVVARMEDKADTKAPRKAAAEAQDAVPPAVPTQVLAIHADKLYVRPDRVLEDVTVLVQDGVITAVGADVKAPEKARKLGAKVVCAGFVDAWSSFALDETSFGDERISAASTALDAVDPYVDGRLEREVLRGGVTTFRLQPSPGARISGVGAILRLHPNRLLLESTVLADCALALSMGVGRAGEDVFERANDVDRVTSALADGWAYLEEQNEYKHDLAEWEKKIAEKQKELDDGFKKAKKDREKAQTEAKDKGTEFKEKEYKEDKKPKAPRFDEDKAELARVASGELPLVLEVHRALEIRSLLEGTKRFTRLRLAIAGGTDALECAEELKARRIPVIVWPQPTVGGRPEEARVKGMGLAAALESAGVEVILGSGAAAGIGSRDLPLLAALAVGHGMQSEAALAAITTRPARMFDVSDKVGSLEVGRQADVVVFSGEPFAATTQVRFVISGGDLVVEGR